MKFEVLTIFPELFGSFRKTGLLGKAIEKGLLEIGVTDIREFATDKHRTVDDTPYGGGAGMVMKIEPIAKALGTLEKIENGNNENRVVVLSARGERFDQAKAEEYARLDQLVLICGRYEGIDQRVADHLADEEISIGSYVLNGGEVAAMVVMEAVSRLVPGVLGNVESLQEESFNVVSHPNTNGVPVAGSRDLTNDELTPSRPSPEATEGAAISPLIRGRITTEYPQYTKPAEFKGWKAPEVLLSGNHAEIKIWREKHSGTGKK